MFDNRRKRGEFDYRQIRGGVLTTTNHTGSKLIKSLQTKLWISVGSLCLVLRNLEGCNEPMKMVNFDKWNPVIQMVFNQGVPGA